MKKFGKKTKRSPSPSHDSSSSRLVTKRRSSRSPSSHYKKYTLNTPIPLNVQLNYSPFRSKRRSRSASIETTPHRYSSRDSPAPSRRHRSPSPIKSSSRSARSPDSHSGSSQRRSARDASPPSRPRTAEKHRHKHGKY